MNKYFKHGGQPDNHSACATKMISTSSIIINQVKVNRDRPEAKNWGT